MHASPPPPRLEDRTAVVLYSKPGCHLCEDARSALAAVLAQRQAAGDPAPPLVERDITSDPAWEREFFLTIPVIEVGDRRLELATSPTRIRALLADALDGPASRGGR
jgi:glutaredoxin